MALRRNDNCFSLAFALAFFAACSAESFSGGFLDAGGVAPEVGIPTSAGAGGSGSGGADSTIGTGGVGSGGAGTGGVGSGGAPGTGGLGMSVDAGAGGAPDDAGMDPGRGDAAADAPPASHTATLTGPTPTALAGNAMGGGQSQDDCPAGQALIGFTGSLNNTDATIAVNRQITAVCGVIAINGTSVTVKAGTTLTTRGMAGVLAWTRSCAANQVVVGFSGRNGSLMDQLVFHCAPLTVSSAAIGTTVMAGNETALASVGGNGGAAFTEIKCPAGQIGAGVLVRTGTEMDAFSIVCSKAAIAP